MSQDSISQKEKTKQAKSLKHLAHKRSHQFNIIHLDFVLQIYSKNLIIVEIVCNA